MSKSLSEFSDVELLVLIKSGNKAAFEEVYQRYWGILYIHVLKFLRNEEEAKDVLQDLFVSLWMKSADLNINTSLSAYLYSAIRNKAFNLIDRKAIQDNYVQSIAQFIDRNEYTSDQDLRLKELKHEIESEINRLPEKMRKIFEMSRIEYLSHKEIAEKLGISDKTVRKQINNAIKIIRNKVNCSPLTVIFMLFK